MAEPKAKQPTQPLTPFEKFVSVIARVPKDEITTDDGGKKRVPPSGSAGAKRGPKPGAKRKTKG